MFKEASELLPFLPAAEGDAVHCLMTGRADLAVFLTVMLDHYGGKCQQMHVSTLSFNGRNVCELVGWLESGKVQALTLMASCFFQQHNKELFTETRETAARFPGRWRMAAARSHAKICVLDFGDRQIVAEGSANLRGNGNLEQLTVIQDAELAAWNAAWIDNEVSQHEHDRDDDDRDDDRDE